MLGEIRRVFVCGEYFIECGWDGMGWELDRGGGFLRRGKGGGLSLFFHQKKVCAAKTRANFQGAVSPSPVPLCACLGKLGLLVQTTVTYYLIVVVHTGLVCIAESKIWFRYGVFVPKN